MHLLPRPRTIVHPGPPHPVRIEHRQSPQARHFRLALPAGRSVHDAIVQALAAEQVHSASMTLLDGALELLTFCLGQPDPTGRVVANYRPAQVEHRVRFITGNATLGRSAEGAPVIHCHGLFRTADGRVLGGHLLTEQTIVGAQPVIVRAASLDGFDLRVGYDEETRMPLLRPMPKEDRHA